MHGLQKLQAWIWKDRTTRTAAAAWMLLGRMLLSMQEVPNNFEWYFEQYRFIPNCEEPRVYMQTVLIPSAHTNLAQAAIAS